MTNYETRLGRLNNFYRKCMNFNKNYFIRNQIIPLNFNSEENEQKGFFEHISRRCNSEFGVLN